MSIKSYNGSRAGPKKSPKYRFSVFILNREVAAVGEWIGTQLLFSRSEEFHWKREETEVNPHGPDFSTKVFMR